MANKHLTEKERVIIEEKRKEGWLGSQIASYIGRSKSCVNGEIKRHKDKDGKYNSDQAQKAAIRKRKGKRKKILDCNIELRDGIVKMIQEGWAPCTISGDYKLSGQYCVSTETIYQWLYSSDYSKSNQLYSFLPLARQKRQPRTLSRRNRKRSIPNRTSIHDRPAIAKEKVEVGHFESDLTFNKGNQSMNISAIVDKLSQKVFLVLNHCKKARTVITGLTKRAAEIPEQIRSTITFDNGKEFCSHVLLQMMGFKTYFCDPYSPNQKPLVEKMNAMIHRFIPKTMDITKLTQKDILDVEEKLNNMPRKSLGFKTPNQVWDEKISQQMTTY